MQSEEKQKNPTEAAGYIVGVGLGMTRFVPRIIIALVLINVGVFFAVAAMLPQASSYSYTGSISYIINSRVHWEIAWLATLASTCITCIFRFVLLGSFERGGQAGVVRPVATGRTTVRAGTLVPRIRFGVMRPVARSARAHCPKLEPLLEHDNCPSS